MGEERYTELFSDESVQHQAGVPVLLLSCLLRHDGENGMLAAHLRMLNIGRSVIREVGVALMCRDATGGIKRTRVAYRYTGLYVRPGEVFGDLVPITIPKNTVASFAVRVTDLRFVLGRRADYPKGGGMKKVPDTENTLAPELLEHLRQEADSELPFVTSPARAMGLVRCACGRWNAEEAKKCARCGTDLSWQFENADEERLRAVHEERLAHDAKLRRIRKYVLIGVACAAAVAVCVGIIATRPLRLRARYEAALGYMDEGDYDAAEELLTSLGEYEDAPQYLERIEADRLYDAGDRIGAYALYSGMDESFRVHEAEYRGIYDAGQALLAEGKTSEAYRTLQLIRGYADTEELLASEPLSSEKAGYDAWRALLVPGATVPLGTWQGEAVNWIVLAAEGNERVLIAEHALFASSFDAETTDWEDSSLREYLKSEFTPAVFPGSEKYLLHGDVTLLSADEASRYFADDAARVCRFATQVSVGEEAANGRSDTCDWWLRTPGRGMNMVACVTDSGAIDDAGYSISRQDMGVRPVIRLVIPE